MSPFAIAPPSAVLRSLQHRGRGPDPVDAMSRYVVNNVTGVWGMQVAELQE
jgi:hypothetical protein